MGHDFAHEAVASASLGSVVRVKGCLVRQVIYWCKGFSNGWLPAVYHSLKDQLPAPVLSLQAGSDAWVLPLGFFPKYGCVWKK